MRSVLVDKNHSTIDDESRPVESHASSLARVQRGTPDRDRSRPPATVVFFQRCAGPTSTPSLDRSGRRGIRATTRATPHSAVDARDGAES